MAISIWDITEIEQHPEWLKITEQYALTQQSMLSDISALRDEIGSDISRALVEMVVARRQASGKLPRTWWMSSEAAQQATPYVVARRRAQRLREFGVALVHDVTCSIGTEVAALTASGITTLGSDLDEARVRMARHNAPEGQFAVADALQPATMAAPVVVADPARRANGRRITKPEDLMPPLPALLKVWAGHEMAIKCAPGLDFSEWDGSVVVTSVDGGVKEACLYTPGLSRKGITREAWVVHSDRGDDVNEAAQVDVYTDAMDDGCGVAEPGRYLVEPDGAIVRAGLVRHFATSKNLWQIDQRIAHLSGDELSPGVSGFKILEQVGLKHVRKTLAAYGCGSAEILVRGVDVNPDALRKQWKLKGTRPMAVVISRIGKKAVAFICEPREVGSVGEPQTDKS